MTETFIPQHGGYRKLFSYQKAEIVYDATIMFCKKFLNKRDRTVDQMIQAARSGKQNIAEASMFSATSKKLEISLTNTASASQEELLVDYQDFLRTRGFQEWDKNSKEALFIRRLSAGKIGLPEKVGVDGGYGTNGTDRAWGRERFYSLMNRASHRPCPAKRPVTFDTFRDIFDTCPPDIFANIMICLINQTKYLLDQQVRRLEQDFIKDGGMSERMLHARLRNRNIEKGDG